MTENDSPRCADVPAFDWTNVHPAIRCVEINWLDAHGARSTVLHRPEVGEAAVLVPAPQQVESKVAAEYTNKAGREAFEPPERTHPSTQPRPNILLVLKHAAADASVTDAQVRNMVRFLSDEPITDADLERTEELAQRHGWERAAVSPLVPAPEPKIMEHAVKPTMSAAEVLAHPQPFPSLVPAPPEPQQEAVRVLAVLKSLMARSEQDRQFGPHACRQACLQVIEQSLRAAAARSPTPAAQAWQELLTAAKFVHDRLDGVDQVNDELKWIRERQALALAIALVERFALPSPPVGSPAPAKEP